MRTQPSFSFGALLRQYRQAAGLSQEALAERARLSRTAIDTLERGVRRTPRKATVALLAEALSLTDAERTRLEAAARQGDPDASPSPSQSALLPPVRGPSWPLVGRTRELVVLVQHLAGTGPPVLLLAGEPGIGKSRLLQEATGLAAAQGWTVLEGGCQRRSGQEPFAPLVGALEGSIHRMSLTQQRRALDGCAWLVRLLPELAETTLVQAPSWTLPPEQERRLMFAAVGRFLANIAGRAGTLLVLDDLQWAGADALDLLTRLVLSPASASLRLLGAYRSTEVHPPDPLGVALTDLAAAGLLAQQPLEALARSEARHLLEQLLVEEAAPVAEEVEQVLVRTGGVPYFLVSCAQALRPGAPAGRPTAALPWNVAESIRQRVGALPAVAQDVLGVAAVVGREAPGSLLLRLAKEPKEDVLAGLEALDQARLLTEGENALYQFPHDLIREVVLSDLSILRRRLWHGAIAAALEQMPGELPIEQLADHYRQADDHEKAILYLERVGDRARTLHAQKEAEGAYRALLAQLDGLDRLGESARVCWKLSRVLSAQARYEEVLALLEQATERYRLAGDPAGQWRTLAQIGFEHIFLPDPQAGLARLEPWLASVKQAGLLEIQTIFQSCLSALYLLNMRFREALAESEEALALARTLPQARRVRLATVMRAQALMALGHLEEAIQALEQIIPVQEAITEDELLNTFFTLSVAYLITGDVPRSAAVLERGLLAAERMGHLLWSALFQALRGFLAFLRGDWRQTRQDCEQELERSRQDHLYPVLFTVLYILGQIGLAQGQREAALQQMEEAMTIQRQGYGAVLQPFYLESILAEDDLLHGKPATAQARLEAISRRFGDQSGLHEAEFWPFLGWAALEAGAGERAEALIARGIERARTYQHRIALVEALRIQALLRLRQQRWAEAEAALEETLALCRAMPYPYAEAKALYVYGLLYQARGDQETARERLEDALSICARLGERLYAEQIEEALAVLER
jgi:tetratricopeptide (TPR) repeat protein/transcriptional regulator with XRE-family HTH domain